MQERLPRKEAEKEADEIRDVTRHMYLFRPTSEQYEMVDERLTWGREMDKRLKGIAQRIADLPEARKIFNNSRDFEEFQEKINALIFSKFQDGELSDLQEIWKEGNPNQVDLILLRQIALLLSQRNEMEVKSITSYNTDTERFYDGEDFIPGDIIEEISKNQNILFSDIGLFEVIKDKNGKTISLSFIIDEIKSLEVFQKFVHYTLYYPQKRKLINPNAVAPPHPMIVIVFGDTETESKKQDIIAEFRDGAWHWEKQF